MTENGIRILTPITITVIDETEFVALRVELEKIAAAATRWPMVETLIVALEQWLGPIETVPVYHPTETGRALLLRATDHLRNLGHTGELLTLRDRLLGTSDLKGHRHRLLFSDGQLPQDFIRYSTPYAAGDRLVNQAGDELRVTGIDTRNPDALSVEPWQPEILRLA